MYEIGVVNLHGYSEEGVDWLKKTLNRYDNIEVVETPLSDVLKGVTDHKKRASLLADYTSSKQQAYEQTYIDRHLVTTTKTLAESFLGRVKGGVKLKIYLVPLELGVTPGIDRKTNRSTYEKAVEKFFSSSLSVNYVRYLKEKDKNIQFLNVSYGTTLGPEKDGILIDNFNKLAKETGIGFVQASGNRGLERVFFGKVNPAIDYNVPGYPDKSKREREFDFSVLVAKQTENPKRADLSGFTPVVAAPGKIEFGGRTAKGTSYSAPRITGMLAALLAESVRAGRVPRDMRVGAFLLNETLRKARKSWNRPEAIPFENYTRTVDRVLNSIFYRKSSLKGPFNPNIDLEFSLTNKIKTL